LPCGSLPNFWQIIRSPLEGHTGCTGVSGLAFGSCLRRFIVILAAFLCLAAGPSRADWREDMGTFRVAIAADGNAALAAAKAEPFRLALEKALSMPVEIVTARDYGALIEAAGRSRIEYSVMSSTAFAALIASCECMEPLVLASSGDGANSFEAQLIVRGDGPAAIDGLKGRKIGVVGGRTIGAPMVALHEMVSAGLDAGGGQAEIVTLATASDAVEALASGGVDAILGWGAVGGTGGAEGSGTQRLIAARAAGAFPYTVLWRSSPIPYRVHAVRKDIAGEAKSILRSTVTGLFGSDPVAYDAIEPAFGGGFVAARSAQFEVLAEMFRSRGLGKPDATR
jgi:phosphonate transport system substrate-binding protein